MPIGSYKTGNIALSNATAGTYYYQFGFTDYEYFNIHTATITGATVTIEGTLDDSTWLDVTNNLFSTASLSSSTEYIADTYMTYKDIQLKIVLPTSSNSVNITWMVKKGGGR